MGDYTRDYYRGRSFNFAGEWTINMHYYNDEYNTDFVTYKGALLACRTSHYSERTYEPTLLYNDLDNPKIPTGVQSSYWSFVTGGTPGPKGGVLVPKYNEETGMLSWSLVDGDDVNVPESSYIKGKDGLTPMFRVNSGGFWEVSYNNGVSYTSTGAKAQGEKGDPFTYNDLTDAQKAELQKPAKDAAQEVNSLKNKAEVLLENLKGAAADATRAAGRADKASDEVDKAVANANAAVANANSAIDKANNATNNVDNAIRNINTAIEKATNATNSANSAATKAEQWNNTVREVIAECQTATDKADTAAKKVFALLGLVENSKNSADSALKEANTALENAKKAEEMVNSAVSNANKATSDAKDATSKLQDALNSVNQALQDAEEFKEQTTKELNDLKDSLEEAINDFTSDAQEQIEAVIGEYVKSLEQLKSETEAALEEAKNTIDSIYSRIEEFVNEHTEELHRLYGDVEKALANLNDSEAAVRKAIVDADEATIACWKQILACREECDLTRQERQKANKAAERAEASAQACDDFVSEYKPKMDAIEASMETLVGEDSDKSVRTIANEELVKQLIPENAKDSLDTLEEIAKWIQSHPDDASAMNADIERLKADMKTGEQMITAEVSRSTEKDSEHDSKISTLETTVETLVSEGTVLKQKNDNVIKTLGMNEDGTFDVEGLKDTHYITGDDANGDHIETVKQALRALDSKLYDVAADTTDYSGLLDVEVERATAKENELDSKIDSEINRVETKLDSEITNLENRLNSEHEEVANSKVDKSSVNQPNGVAGLDENGFIYRSQIPTLFDDVKSGYMDTRPYTDVSPSNGSEPNPNYMRFFARHENGEYLDKIEEDDDKLYVDKETNLLYR